MEYLSATKSPKFHATIAANAWSIEKMLSWLALGGREERKGSRKTYGESRGDGETEGRGDRFP